MVSLCATQCHLGQLEAHFQQGFPLTGLVRSVVSGVPLLASVSPSRAYASAS